METEIVDAVEAVAPAPVALVLVALELVALELVALVLSNGGDTGGCRDLLYISQ